VSGWELLALLKSQMGDFWRLQLSFIGFFGNWLVEAFLLKKPWRKLPPELVTDMFYFLFMPTLRMLGRAISVSVLVGFGVWFGLQADPEMLRGFGPVANQPRALIIIEVVVLMDFITYWAHRSFHTFPLLWRFHSLHHSAKYVRWSTTGRVHPLNELFNYLVTVLPLALIGFPVNVVMPVTPAVIVFALFAHTQVNVSYGPLSTIFVSPRFHRWHHTHSHEGGNKNFANVFSLWDRLFGTFYLPPDRLPETFGLDVDDVPESYLGQLLYPWRKPRTDSDSHPVDSRPHRSFS
jgi:sterol desaturase/sphingolipid hydroxylase (fatty acid hydroxylase superfamily)